MGREENDAGSLPAVYATVLRMRAGGESDASIARAVGCPVEAVESLGVIAARKAARAWADDFAKRGSRVRQSPDGEESDP